MLHIGKRTWLNIRQTLNIAIMVSFFFSTNMLSSVRSFPSISSNFFSLTLGNVNSSPSCNITPNVPTTTNGTVNPPIVYSQDPIAGPDKGRCSIGLKINYWYYEYIYLLCNPVQRTFQSMTLWKQLCLGKASLECSALNSMKQHLQHHPSP